MPKEEYVVKFFFAGSQLKKQVKKLSKLGLIAGKGELPLEWAKAAQEKDFEIIAYQLMEAEDKNLESCVEQLKKVSLGQLDKLIKTLLNDGIREIVIIGKIEKSLLYQDLTLDNRFKKLLAGLDNYSSDNISLAVIKELNNAGIDVLEQHIHLDKLVAEKGLLNSAKIDEKLFQEMKYGLKLAREIARLEIGQTVILKDNDVVAVEAIEGTDKTIQRAGKHAGEGILMAKASKPGQDYRFDTPTVGYNTLMNLIAVSAKALVLEAGSTFIINKDNFLKKAEENNLLVYAMSAEDLE